MVYVCKKTCTSHDSYKHTNNSCNYKSGEVLCRVCKAVFKTKKHRCTCCGSLFRRIARNKS